MESINMHCDACTKKNKSKFAVWSVMTGGFLYTRGLRGGSSNPLGGALLLKFICAFERA